MRRKKKKVEFKIGMVLAISIEPSESADSADLFIIDTARIPHTRNGREWLAAIKEEIEKDNPENDHKIGVQRGQQTFPENWETLAKGKVKKFPVTIDGAISLFYENV